MQYEYLIFLKKMQDTIKSTIKDNSLPRHFRVVTKITEVSLIFTTYSREKYEIRDLFM